MQHTDLIRVYAQNKKEAREIVRNFLECYKKENICTLSVAGSGKYFEVQTFYTDNYDDNGIFKSSDYVEVAYDEEKKLTKKIQNL